MQIWLASTSPYRKEQLHNFGLEFRAKAPSFDEESYKSSFKNPKKLCRFLARKKAESLTLNPSSNVNSGLSGDIIIGADQLVNLHGQILGKPKTRENAIAMLKLMSGKTHELVTCLCLYHNGKHYEDTVVAKITMRKLKSNEILSYVYRDQPLDCAGSYKLELSGLSLVKKISVSDPSSLTGLPLISLMNMLIKIGAPIPFRAGLS